MIRSSSFGGLGQPPAKQPFSFGGASSSSQTQAQPQQQQQQPSTGGFSFGQSTTQQQQPSSTTNNAAGSSSLFGAPKPATATGGFSFGAPSSSQQQQSQQQQTNPAPALGGSLFGGGASTSTQPTSLFGQQPQQQQPQQAAPSFGASSSLFGQQSQPQLGASTSAAAGPSSSSPFSRHAFYQKERFNDLPDDARKLVEEMDALMSSHVAIRDEVHPKLVPAAGNELAPLGQQIHALYAQLHDATVTLSALSATVEYQQANVRNLASGAEADRRDFVQLWEMGDAYRQSQQQQQQASSSMMAMQHQQQAQQQQSQQGQPQQPFGQSQGPQQQAQAQSSPTPNNAHKHRQFLSSYFARSATDFMHRVQQYRRSLDDVSRHLASLSSRDRHSPRAISDTIYFQHETFMGLAAQVAGLHGEVEGLKRDYRAWYAKQFKSVRDPFERMGEDLNADL